MAMADALKNNRTETWSIYNAFAIIAALILTLVFNQLGILVAVFSVSVLALIAINKNSLGKSKFFFGIANTITLLRYLIIVFALLMIGPTDKTLLFYYLSLAVVLDLFDGMAARHFKETSFFGQYFDMEVDAFYVLSMCCFYYLFEGIAFWILIPGILRYAFRIYTFCFPRPYKKEDKKTYATIIAASYFIVLLLGLITNGLLRQLILILGSLTLVVSFTIGFIEYNRPTKP